MCETVDNDSGSRKRKTRTEKQPEQNTAGIKKKKNQVRTQAKERDRVCPDAVGGDEELTVQCDTRDTTQDIMCLVLCRVLA